MQKKKGISLIVLVVTIIVMIILSASVILSIGNINIINNAMAMPKSIIRPTPIALKNEKSWITVIDNNSHTINIIVNAVSTKLNDELPVGIIT